MNKKNFMKRLLMFSLAFIFVLTGLGLPLYSQAETKGRIIFEFEGIDNAEFRLYKVAVQDGHDGYTFINGFEKYAEYIDIFASPQAAETLEHYVNTDAELTPIRTELTDENGIIVFEDVEEGAYLILGDDFERDDFSFIANPVLLSVPSAKKDGDGITWEVKVQDKYDIVYSGPEKDTTVLNVQKVWDGENAPEPPESIDVLLYDGTTLVERATLTAENNWFYSWENLDINKDWEIKEDLDTVPEGYKVNISNKDTNNTVVITNTWTKDNPPEPTPTPTPPSPNPHNGSSSSSLPQTGQLWWPVSILLCIGMLCMIIGIRLGRKKEN